MRRTTVLALSLTAGLVVVGGSAAAIALNAPSTPTPTAAASAPVVEVVDPQPGETTLLAVDATTASLLFMIEEEKLAHDVYVALAAKYPATVQFARIANAEATHLASIQTLLARYGIDDPTTGMAAGEFRTAAFQSLYDDLVARATTTASALAVGVTIEKLDIADLTSAMSGLTAPDVLQVYTNLRNGSERHLAAFGG